MCTRELNYGANSGNVHERRASYHVTHLHNILGTKIEYAFLFPRAIKRLSTRLLRQDDSCPLTSYIRHLDYKVI